jgi:hypothetical protein
MQEKSNHWAVRIDCSTRASYDSDRLRCKHNVQTRSEGPANAGHPIRRRPPSVRPPTTKANLR